MLLEGCEEVEDSFAGLDLLVSLRLRGGCLSVGGFLLCRRLEEETPRLAGSADDDVGFGAEFVHPADSGMGKRGVKATVGSLENHVGACTGVGFLGLKSAEDAVLVDSSNMTIEEVVQKIRDLCHR